MVRDSVRPLLRGVPLLHLPFEMNRQLLTLNIPVNTRIVQFKKDGVYLFRYFIYRNRVEGVTSYSLLVDHRLNPEESYMVQIGSGDITIRDLLTFLGFTGYEIEFHDEINLCAENYLDTPIYEIPISNFTMKFPVLH